MKRIISLITAFVILFGVMAFTAPTDGASLGLNARASGEVAVGKCGPSANYTLYSDGRLVISGSGPMNTYDYMVAPVPWNSYKSSITSVEVSGVTSIGQDAFRGCTNLTSVSLSDGLTTIEGYAFYNCASLPSIVLPDSVTSIGEATFQYCYLLENITLSKKLTSIEPLAFSDCSSLKSIAVPSGVTTIINYAFAHCTSLTSISIPVSVTSVAFNAFLGCYKLDYVYYEGGKSDWDKIKIANGNTSLREAIVKYSTPSSLPGDINSDGEVNLLDSTVLRRHLAGWGVTINVSNADVNNDGKVDMKDFTILRRYLAGWSGVELK